MGNFNIMGSYSGVDISVIDQMIEAEKSKGVQFTNRKEKIEREQGAWKDVGTRLTSLGQKTDVLSRRDTFESRTVKSSATANAAVSVTAGNSAPVGDYQVQVKQLATSSRLTGNKINLDFTDISEAEKKKNPLDRKMGLNDSFKFKNADGKAFEIKVTSDDSLRKITENINKETKESGIRASIVDNRLILTDNKMGKRDISIENNETTKKLGFTNFNITGNKINVASIEGGTFSFEAVNKNGEDITLSVEIGSNAELSSIVGQINSAAEDLDTGVKASIEDGRLVLINTSLGAQKIKITDGEMSKALGFVDTTTSLTGEATDFETIGVDGELTVGDIVVDIKLTDTLQQVVDKINEKTEGTGITAYVDAGNKLLLTAEGAHEIIVDDNNTGIVEKLGLTGIEKVQESIVKSGSIVTSAEQRGQGSIFTIDGLKIERDTNRISDAIEGMAFTLSSVHAEGASDLISVTNNTQKGVDAMKEFVDQYNSVMSFIQTQTDVGSPGEDNNTTGALVGEGSIMRLQSGLRTTLMQRINGKSMSDFGVEIDRYGVATLDEAKLNKALQDDPTSVSRFFYRPELAPDGTGDVPKGEEPKDTQGMSELFKNFLETYTARSKGIISTKNQSYDRMVKQINEQIETFNERIDRKRDRYIQQFAALDEAMMRAESQMEYLWSQMNIE